MVVFTGFGEISPFRSPEGLFSSKARLRFLSGGGPARNCRLKSLILNPIDAIDAVLDSERASPRSFSVVLKAPFLKRGGQGPRLIGET